MENLQPLVHLLGLFVAVQTQAMASVVGQRWCKICAASSIERCHLLLNLSWAEMVCLAHRLQEK